MYVLRCVVFLAVVLVGTGACGEVKNPGGDAPSQPDDAAVPGDAAPIDGPPSDTIPIDAASGDDFAVTVAPTARVINGQSISIEVQLGRGAQHTAAVAFSVAGLPAGVTAAPLTIAGTASTGQLTLTATATATHGFHDLMITAAGGGKTHNAPLNLAVTDLPGKFDRSFAGTGFIVSEVTPQLDQGFALIGQADGKIVVGESHNSFIGAERYLADGSRDASFGTDGRTTTTFPAPLASVTLQPDGKILLVGSPRNSGAVIRLNASGTLDTTFNGAGVVTAGTTGEQVIVQPDGKLLFFVTNNAGGATNAELVRLNADGTVDTRFATGGIFVATPPKPPGSPAQTTQARALFLTPQGTIVLVGEVSRSTTQSAFVARLTAAGAPDTSFGPERDGYVNMIDTRPDLACKPTMAKLAADGKVVIAGSISGTVEMFAMRLEANGAIDANYGDLGIGRVGVNVNPTDLALAADGSAFLVGTNSALIVARLDPRGRVDTTWASNPVEVRTEALGNAVAVMPDSRVVVTGAVIDGAVGPVALARLWP